jgi:hypothetical protein
MKVTAMASGRKNYFRHSFNAFEDEKIQNAVDKLGYEGYAYYFILLEILAKQCENEFKNPIRIHQQTLRTVWRKQSKSCKKVVTKLQESGLFVATFNESFVEFDIPNLQKYLGKYTTKNDPNASNKKKRKEIKEKEIKKEQKSKFDLEEIYANYPRKEGKSAGIKKLTQVIKNQVEYDSVLQGAKDYKKHCEINETEKRYIKIFSSWVNQECWKDTYDTVSAEEDLKNWLDGEIEKGLGVENVPQRIHE